MRDIDLLLWHSAWCYRHGLIAGLDEGDDFVHVYFHQGPYPVQHWYSHLAEAYRAFAEIGQVWIKVGASSGRKDVSAHGRALLAAAPAMYHDLHASLNKTANTTASPGYTCYPDNAGVFGDHESYGGGCMLLLVYPGVNVSSRIWE
jgi:hypothetical protein